MQTNELNSDLLRRLAKLRPEGAYVLSLFLNLDPSQFGTAPARATEASSVIDQANALLRDADGLSHGQQKALRADIERADAYFRGAEFSAEGAHGLALYVCGPADLFEAIKLPRSIESRAVIDDSPFVEPLAELGIRDGWCILLVNRRVARMLRGSRDQLIELPSVQDEVHGQHEQGGWSQARFQRSVDKEAQDHLKHTVDELLRLHKRRAFDALFVGAPEAVYTDFCERLHPYLAERLAGRVDVDVENTIADNVQQAAEEVIADHERKLEEETLDRLVAAKSSNGRGSTGLEATLTALNEQRVEALLLQENFDAAGVCCPQCGSLYPAGVSACPADGTPTVERGDITDLAVRRAITQAAQVVIVRDDDRLEPLGSIAALLRF
jgi:peptide subunit release factor 1 (eRF1)